MISSDIKSRETSEARNKLGLNALEMIGYYWILLTNAYNQLKTGDELWNREIQDYP